MLQYKSGENKMSIRGLTGFIADVKMENKGRYYPCKELYAYSLYALPEFMLGVTNEFKKRYCEENEK
ncbi:MAG TPA: hypothetical protein DGG95_03190 [Cytophagales bacterium]|jgi:hypothetical protein|nr:hypothetical protein [Cytophagales bacterium]